MDSAWTFSHTLLRKRSGRTSGKKEILLAHDRTDQDFAFANPPFPGGTDATRRSAGIDQHFPRFKELLSPEPPQMGIRTSDDIPWYCNLVRRDLVG